MMKHQLSFIFFFLTINSFSLIGQTMSELALPIDIHDSVSLTFSDIENQVHTIPGEEYFTVFIKHEDQQHLSNPVQGQYIIVGEQIIFKPFFPFESNLTYTIRFKNNQTDNSYSYQEFIIKSNEGVEEAKVNSIYPTANQLPDNLLRFYIYFNTPMKKGQALDHVKLIDEKGNIDKHAFMQFKQELWSPDGKRLTILFDPGRIKRGVSTNELRGPALTKGRKYSLIISGDWEDVNGQQLSINYKKDFEVFDGYRQELKTNNWQLQVPKENTDDVLLLKFDRIIDHALVQSMLTIADEEKNMVSGYWEILESEMLARFIPQEKWKKGNYRIVADGRLEDIAGNNLDNLLDHIKSDNQNTNKLYHYIKFTI